MVPPSIRGWHRPSCAGQYRVQGDPRTRVGDVNSRELAQPLWMATPPLARDTKQGGLFCVLLDSLVLQS